MRAFARVSGPADRGGMSGVDGRTIFLWFSGKFHGFHDLADTVLVARHQSSTVGAARKSMVLRDYLELDESPAIRIHPNGSKYQFPGPYGPRTARSKPYAADIFKTPL